MVAHAIGKSTRTGDQARRRICTTLFGLLTDGEALDIVQNSPANNEMEVCRRMVTRLEPKVPSWFRGLLPAMLFPMWCIPGAEHGAWEKQVQDHEQQSGVIISAAIKLGFVLCHLHDASLREHLLLNSRSYVTYTLMAALIRTVAMARTTW